MGCLNGKFHKDNNSALYYACCDVITKRRLIPRRCVKLLRTHVAQKLLLHAEVLQAKMSQVLLKSLLKKESQL